MSRLRLLCAAGFLALVCVALLSIPAAPPKPEEKESPTEPEGGVVLQDAEEGRPALVLDTGGHTAFLHGVFFLKEGRELLTVSRDGTIRFWDVDAGLEPLRVLYPPLRNLTGAAYDAGTHTLALAGNQGKEFLTLLLDVETSAIRRRLQVPKQTATAQAGSALAFSADGRWLACTGPDVPLQLWDVKEAKLHKILEGPGSKGYGVAFNPDGSSLMTASLPDGIRPWTVPDGKAGEPLRGHEKDFRTVAFSPADGTKVAFAGPHGAYLWDGKRQSSEQLTDRVSHGVTFSPDSRMLLVPHSFQVPPASSVTLFDLKTRKMTRLGPDKFALKAAGFSPDGQVVVTTGDGHQMFLSRTSPGPTLLQVLAAGAVTSLTTPDFPSAMTQLVTLKQSQDPLAQRTSCGKLISQHGGLGRPHFSAAWSEDGTSIAWGDVPGGEEERFPARIPLQFALSLTRLQFLPKQEGPDTRFDKVRRAQLSHGKLTLKRPDENTLTIVGADKEVSYKDPLTLVFCATFAGPNRVVVALRNHALFLLDAKTGKKVCHFKGQQGLTQAVAVSPDEKYLLAALMDKTLRIWSLEEAEKAYEKAQKAGPDSVGEVQPMVSLFVAGQEWIAWTPQGSYAASPDGERLVGWRVSNGPDKLATFYPAEQFHNTYYRPDIIKGLLREGGLDKAKEAKPLAEVLPPSVTISEPNKSAILLLKEAKSQLTIKAEATLASKDSKDPVTHMQLFLDGAPYDRDKGTVTFKAGELPTATWKVKVPPGRHRFTVVARTARSEGESELWVNNLAEPELPRLFVLAIGNNDYQNVGKLTCATKDAKKLVTAFKDYNKSKQLFSDVKPKVVEDANRQGILDALGWLKKEEMTKDDVAVFFYSGHGHYEDKGDDKGEFWLLSVEADLKKLSDTAVSGVELKNRLKGLPCRRMLVLLDACHSGGLDGLEDLRREFKQPDCGVVAICSSAREEKSWENEKEGHGYFTLSLVDGLGGKARPNPAGQITVLGLAVYVEEQVQFATQGKQNPVIGKPTGLRAFALAKP